MLHAGGRGAMRGLGHAGTGRHDAGVTNANANAAFCSASEVTAKNVLDNLFWYYMGGGYGIKRKGVHAAQLSSSPARNCSMAKKKSCSCGSLQDIPCANPLEKFVLVLKEEMDSLFTELHKLRKDVEELKQKTHVYPDPIALHIEGSKVAMRFFMRLLLCKDISMYDCANLLYTKVHVPYRFLHIVNRGLTRQSRYLIEMCVQCTEYVMLGNIGARMNEVFGDYLNETSLMYILNLERSADAICTLNDIAVLQMQKENTPFALKFVINNGKVEEEKVHLETINPYFKQIQRDFPLVIMANE